MMQKGDTVVQFSGLKPGRYEYQYTLDDSFFESFENDELQHGNVAFSVVMDRQPRMLMFYFSFTGSIETTCDRCLGKMTVPVSGEHTMCVKVSSQLKQGMEDETEDAVLISEQAYQIDLAQWMYEYVAMAVPIQHAHDESECDPEMLRYISKVESSEGEMDPRWEALKKLK